MANQRAPSAVHTFSAPALGFSGFARHHGPQRSLVLTCWPELLTKSVGSTSHGNQIAASSVDAKSELLYESVLPRLVLRQGLLRPLQIPDAGFKFINLYSI